MNGRGWWKSRRSEPGYRCRNMWSWNRRTGLVITPIVDYVLKIEAEHPSCQIVLVIPELIEQHWYHYFLQSNRAELLKGLMLLRGNDNIVIANLPWYLKRAEI